MDDVPLRQMVEELLIYRPHIVHVAPNAPVCQRCLQNLYAQLFPVCLLTAERDTVHILLVHHIGDSGWRSKAVLEQGTRCFGSNDNRSAVFLTFRAAKDFLDILDPFHFCRDDPQFFTDDFFTDDFHRGIAVWAVPILIRHRAGNLHYRESRQNLFPGGFRLLCLAFIPADSLLQRWFRNGRGRLCFRFIEQIHLSGEHIRFRPFAGRRKQLFLQILNRFVEVCSRLVQLSGLFLMAFRQLSDGKPLAVHQLVQGFNCLFLKLDEHFHF